MKSLQLLLSFTCLYAAKVLSVAIHNMPGFPTSGITPTSLRTDLRSVPGHSPNQTYWEAIGWNNGYIGMQTWFEKRVFLFSLWDNNNGNSSVLEACPECVTSQFGGEGTGVHIQYFYPWVDGVDYGYQVDYEEDGDSVIYTAQLRIEGQWMLFGKLRVINGNFNGLDGMYQFLEHPGDDFDLDTRVGVWSKQAFKAPGNDNWLPCFGGSITYTQPDSASAWGAGLTDNATAVWMAINGPIGNPYDNKPEQWKWLPYEQKNLGLKIVIADEKDPRCGIIDDEIHQCSPGDCCSSNLWCGSTEAYCDNADALFNGVSKPNPL